MNTRNQLLALFDAYCAATKLSRTYVSTTVLNGGSQINRVDAGGDVLTRTFENAAVWFSDNWPDGAHWPEGLSRPVKSEAAA